MPASMNRLSREFVWWSLGSSDDLTGTTVDVALVADPDALPVDADWVTADLIGPDDPMGGGSWWARLLVGPGGPVGTPNPAPGTYQTWLRVTDEPERPVRRPGVLEIL